MSVIVIGGGFAGLCAASSLADRGRKVILLEQLPHLGGFGFPLASDGDLAEPAPRLFFGHYRRARAFLRRIGTAHKLRFPPCLQLTIVDRSAGRRRKAQLRCRGLVPPPIGVSAAIARLGGMSLIERSLALRVVAALHRPSRLAPAAEASETYDQWLDRLGQPAHVRRCLWHPLGMALLRDQPGQAPARLLETSLRSLLLGATDEACIALLTLDAQRLYGDDARRYLEQRGCEIRLQTTVERIELSVDGKFRQTRGVVLAGGERIPASAVVCATSPPALLGMLPAAEREEPYFKAIGQLRAAPTVTVAIGLRSAISSDASMSVVGSPFHWVFHRRRFNRSDLWLQAWRAHDLIGQDDDALVRLATEEMSAVVGATLPPVLEARVVREPNIVLDHAQAFAADRPHVHSPVAGLFVAGDYARTNLPADLESAAVAAEEAASFAAEHISPRTAPPRAFVPVGRLSRRPNAG